MSLFINNEWYKERPSISYFKYKGSLTKPPCSENIDWFIVTQPVDISTSQLIDLKLFGLNRA